MELFHQKHYKVKINVVHVPVILFQNGTEPREEGD